MLDFRPISSVIPVFFLVLLGFLFARWKKISLGPVTEIIVYLTTPSLAFTSLAGRPLFATDIVAVVSGLAGIMGGVGLLIWGYFRLFDFRSRGFALPALFMNAGNMGIPLALFAFGETGLQRATLIFVANSILQNSLGIYILTGGNSGWREMFRLPMIYASVLGLAFNVAEIQVPAPLFTPLTLLGHSTIPLMLVSLGYRLSDLRSVMWRHSLGGALIRIVGGLLAAYVTVTVLGIEGVNRQVILLYGVLPSAVVNFIFTEKYQQDPDLAASIILLTTLFSLVTIPATLWLIM